METLLSRWLISFRFRWYSPELGRWTQQDPIHFAAGDINIYRAIGNDPLNGLDPSGLQKKDYDVTAPTMDGRRFEPYVPPLLPKPKPKPQTLPPFLGKIGPSPSDLGHTLGSFKKIPPNQTDIVDIGTDLFMAGPKDIVEGILEGSPTQTIIGVVESIPGGVIVGGLARKCFKAFQPKGLRGRTGLSYDNKHLQKHLPDTPEAAKLIKKDGKAHVFNDEATLRRVEAEILARGEYTGIVRSGERYGVRFDEPIGYRIDAAGNKIPLHYGEMTLDPKTGKYHLMPRTGPAKE